MQINEKTTCVDVNYLEILDLPRVYLIIEVVHEISHARSEVEKEIIQNIICIK